MNERILIAMLINLKKNKNSRKCPFHIIRTLMKRSCERGEEMSIGVKSPIFYNYLIAALPPNILISYINDM